MHLLILWFRFTSQMVLLSNKNFYFDCRTRVCLIVPGRQEKIYFCTRKFLSTRYTRWQKWTRHLFLTVNTNTWWKAELHLTNSESCTVWLPIEFHGFTSRINSKGYHSLVPGLSLIFLETVWVPLKIDLFLSTCIAKNVRSLGQLLFQFGR